MRLWMLAICLILASTMLTSTPQSQPVLVELFTSEGCSSCPPADRLLTRLAAESDVIAIGYHVDYWNRLGWTDRFSQREFSLRQENYSQLLGSDGVYTPEIVVNGRTEMVGSDERAVRAAIRREQENAVRGNLLLTARRLASGIQVDYEILVNPGSAKLVIVLVQNQATTSVSSGENSGRTLNHKNIVRGLQYVDLSGSHRGQVIAPIPTGGMTDMFIVGFVQAADGRILAVTRAPECLLCG